MNTAELFLAIVLGVTVAKLAEAVMSATAMTAMNWLMSKRVAPLPVSYPAPPPAFDHIPDPLLEAYRDGWRASEECWGVPAGKVPSSDEHIDHHYTWDGTRRAGEKCPPPSPPPPPPEGGAA